MSATAKLVRVSPTLGGQYAVLVGNDASVQRDGAELDTTIFGSGFNSSITGIINHTFSGNAMFRNNAGYKAKIRTTGTPTAFTSQAATLVSGKTYRISNSAQSLWNPLVAIVVQSDGTNVAASDIASINYAIGTVTFVDSFTVAGPVTISGSYLPLEDMVSARSVSISQSADTIETGNFEQVNDAGGYEFFRATLKSVSAELEDFARPTSEWLDKLLAREQVVLEIDLDGNGTTFCRGFFNVINNGQSGGTGGDESETVSLSLRVPEQGVGFGWVFAAQSAAPLSLQHVINSWQNGGTVFIEYLPEGLGKKGTGGEYVITDCSVSVSIDGLAEATVEGQGTGALTVLNP